VLEDLDELDRLERVVVDIQRYDREPATSRALGAFASQAAKQLVTGDPEKPRGGGLRPRPESRSRDIRRGEHLGRQVRGNLRATGLTHEPAQDKTLVAPVEDREGLIPRPRDPQQLLVGKAIQVSGHSLRYFHEPSIL